MIELALRQYQQYERQYDIEVDLISDMLRVEETQENLNIFHEISNMEDVDHMDLSAVNGEGFV